MGAITQPKCNSRDRLRKVIKAHADRGKVKISRFGTSFSIVAVEKNGDTKEVPIVPSSRSDKFLALFEQDNVDFKIVVDNTKSSLRHVGYDLKLLKEKHGYYVSKGWIGDVTALKTRGGKFHFLCKSSEEGESCIGAFAAKRNLSFQEALRGMSQLEFEVDYSEQLREDAIEVIINCFNDKIFVVDVLSSATVEDVKLQIKKDWGYQVEKQRLIFQGKLLQDSKTLKDYGIGYGSEIHMVKELHGGKGSMTFSNEAEDASSDEEQDASSNEEESVYSEEEKDFSSDEEQGTSSDENTDTTVASLRLGANYRWTGERGIVVLGEKTDAVFVSHNYRRDTDHRSARFVIELRRSPRVYTFTDSDSDN